MIPDEAVEAAAKVIALSSRTITEADWEWEHLPKEHWYKAAREALEASEPHILAEAKVEAWEEGKESVWAFLGNLGQRTPPTNPHRSQPMVSDELVEAAAKAMYASQYADPYDNTDTEQQQEFREMARAAIETLAKANQKGQVRTMSRDPEYQADATHSIIFQWKNGAMNDSKAMERLERLYATYEPRRRV